MEQKEKVQQRASRSITLFYFQVVEEINLLKKFANPHIIKFIEAFENPGEVILIMEYLDGGELFERVADEDFNLTELDCCLFM